MAATATSIAVGANNIQLNVVVEKTTVVVVVVAMAAATTMATATAARKTTTATATRTATMAAVEAVAAATVVMGVAMAVARTWQPAIGKRCNYCVDDVPKNTNNVDAPSMAVPGQETTACEEGEGMGNNAMSFAGIICSGSNRSIQAAQGQQRSIAMQGYGVRWAGPIERRRQALLDG
jgi:hypothetical protein